MHLLQLLATLAMVAANGFFVVAEFAITRVRPTLVDEMEEKRQFGAKSVRHAINHIDAYLSACQLGITIASLGLGVIGEPAFSALLEPVLGELSLMGGITLAVAIAFVIITLLHVVVGELAPKSLAISRTDPIVRWVAPPMRVFYLLTKPVVDLFNGLGNLLLKPFGIPPAREAGHAPHSEGELRTLIRQSDKEGLIDAEERQFTENVFVFGDRRAREVMTPRPKIDYLTTGHDARKVAEWAIGTGHTRYPLCEAEGGLDAPLGLIHIKDFLAAAFDADELDLQAIARSLTRVSESMEIDKLLAQLRRGSQHMALVVDEHGTTTGLITLEDIIEEIVGEIEDEFDHESAEVITREGKDARVSGSASIALLASELGLKLENTHEATIGGHILELLGRLPNVGETVDLESYRAEVTKLGEASIEEIRLTPSADSDSESEAAAS